MWAGLAFAQTKPFSHAFHLKAGLGCVSCHTSVESSTKAADNNLPGQAVCKKCHRADMPIKAPARLMVSRFNHEFHLKFGNVGPVIAAAVDAKSYLGPVTAGLRADLNTGRSCGACHRGMERSEAVTKEAFPHMGDCLVCHTKIDAPFSCELCHQPGEHLKPASHTATYVDTHSTGRANLDKQSCVICHGKRFTCLGCH